MPCNGFLQITFNYVDYNINGEAFLRITNVIRDYDVYFDPKLIFNSHIIYTKKNF